MANPQPFEWGAWVMVRRRARASKDGRDRTWGPNRWQREPDYGRIVGVSYKQEGKVHWGSYDDPSHFEYKKTVKLFRVAISWRSEILAFEDDIELCEDRGDLPNQVAQKWTEKEKQDLRDAMEGWPRDEKGQFKPYEPPPR